MTSLSLAKFFLGSKPRPVGERSNDELDMLEIESKLRRRFDTPYSIWESDRFGDGSNFDLPEIRIQKNKIFPGNATKSCIRFMFNYEKIFQSLIKF